MKRLVSVLSAFVLTAPLQAQFLDRFMAGPPTVEVTLSHPPSLNLSVERIAFGQASGECADELVDALIAKFVTQGVEVIDRFHLEALLDEHELSLSGVVNREGVAKLGQILGPAALVFVKARRCASDQERLVGRTQTLILAGRKTPLISRTTGYFKGSIQIIDLGTARIHSAKALDETLRLENTAYDMQPAFPSTYDAIDAVLERAAYRVHQMFFPWTERRTLAFYDSKTCGLSLAYGLLQAGDLAGGLAQSRRNVEACEAFRAKKPKILAHALYNLGMASFLVGAHDEALAHFDASLRIKPSEVTSAAMAACRNSKEAQARMERYEDALSIDVASASSGSTQSSAAPQPQAQKQEHTIEARLKKLDTLLQNGLITEDEYLQKRSEILSEL